MKCSLLVIALSCTLNSLIRAEDIRLLDLEPTDAQQYIENKDQTLKYAPKVDSNVPAVRYIGNEPQNVLEDIYLANQYHGQDGLGGYLYGYSVPDIAKTEKKKAGGDLRGAYNYIAGNGQEIKVEYWDDGTGFHQVDNVPKILPKQIDDSPEVKAAKDAFLKRWNEEAERNTHPIANPYDDHGNYASGPLSPQGQHKQYPAAANQFQQSPQFGAASANQYQQQPQSSVNQYQQKPQFGASSSYQKPQQFGSSGNQYQQQQPFSASVNQYQQQSQFGASSSLNNQKPQQFGSSGNQYQQQQPQFGASSASGNQYQQQPQSSFNQYQQKPQFGASSSSLSNQKPQQFGVSSASGNQYQQSQFGASSSGSQSGASAQYNPRQQQPNYGQFQGGAGQYQPASTSSSSGSYGSQPTPSSLNNVDYSGQYSENKNTYSAQQQQKQYNPQSQANNNNQQDEYGQYKEDETATGPPRGFFYSFDYPVGIIVQKQGGVQGGHSAQKREDLHQIYQQNKQSFESLLKNGAQGGSSHSGYLAQ